MMMMMMTKISPFRRTLACRLMSSHHQKAPQELVPKAPRRRAEDVLTDSSKFFYSAESSSKFKSTMPFETLVQVITEQELAAAKKVVRK